jgi:hypothetical protein
MGATECCWRKESGIGCLQGGGVAVVRNRKKYTSRGRYPSRAGEENVRTLDGLETINCILKCLNEKLLIRIPRWPTMTH